MFIEAWELKDSEFEQQTDREILKVEAEVYRIKKEISSTESKIALLEKENEKLQQHLNTHVEQNQKLRHFKENLKKSLSSSEQPSRIPSKFSIFSPKSSSVDGKNFFRDARSRLSFEGFSIFLGYVKRLNDKTISKERALAELQSVFGDENYDLYEDFSNLLLRKANDYEFS